MQLFAGIEGGASSSKVVLLNDSGTLLGTVDDGPASNVWLIGREEWASRINGMIEQVFEVAKIPKMKLECLGLCLSGCEDDVENGKLSEYILNKYPSLCSNCKIGSDTIGSIMTASATGGIVLIAGTGSNSLYFEPENGHSVRCGGWGHMIGDHGSAYWIANKAIRYIVEDEEGFVPLPVSTDGVRKVIYEHFNVDNSMGLLTPLYTKFDKTHFAKVCSKIAQLAIKEKDALALRIFNDAGRVLAQHICALLPRIKCTTASEVPLPVICVGSVFKSWCLLESGFADRFNELFSNDQTHFHNHYHHQQQQQEHKSEESAISYKNSTSTINNISLSVRFLTETSAIGAAYYAARSINITLPIDFTKNYTELSILSPGKVIQGA